MIIVPQTPHPAPRISNSLFTHRSPLCQVKLVVIDSHNIDNTTGKSRPVHTILLGAEIVIAEHLCHLDQLPDEGFTFTAAPPKFKGAGTFPVRAFASVQQNL